MKKKLITFAMTVFMMLGILSITAGATPTNSGTSSVDITKTLTATGLEDTTFSFKVEEYSISNAATGTTIPDIADFTITVSKGTETDTYSITLPDYESVGIYTYKITETKGNIAGVTYSEAELYLVVTVTNDGSGGLVRTAVLHEGSVDGDKDTQEFKNTYNAGTLNVTKEVTGNLGDTTKEFNVTVTFTKEDGTTVNSTISYVVDGQTYTIDPSVWDSSDTYEVTFKVKHGTTVTFSNIPYNVKYYVEEEDCSTEGYTTTYTVEGGSSQTGTLDSPSETATITNYKNNPIDTGVILDSLPYVLILAVVLLGVVYLIFRKRPTDKY